MAQAPKGKRAKFTVLRVSAWPRAPLTPGRLAHSQQACPQVRGCLALLPWEGDHLEEWNPLSAWDQPPLGTSLCQEEKGPGYRQRHLIVSA